MPVQWMADLLRWLADAFDTELFMVKGVVSILLVCTVCGMVGSLVVGNRMAFFSDAMAHCAFAGVALGFLSVVLLDVGKGAPNPAARQQAVAATLGWAVPLVMVLFGCLMGAGIVYVRERTDLAADTVIGVFFAFVLGLGAMLFKLLQTVSPFNAENFLLGSPYFVTETDLLYLLVLVGLTAGLFGWRYNRLVFASFNPSLARTRGIGLRVNNYLFIILLALVVNLSLKAVGVLLINSMLLVPAAAAANAARNLRQVFWLTVGFCLLSGLGGLYLSTAVSVRVAGADVKFAPSGTIAVFAVAVFAGTAVRRAVGRRPATAALVPAGERPQNTPG